MNAVITLDVRHLPDVILEMRQELARLLVEVAQYEDPIVANRLLHIAARFEVGCAD